MFANHTFYPAGFESAPAAFSSPYQQNEPARQFPPFRSFQSFQPTQSFQSFQGFQEFAPQQHPFQSFDEYQPQQVFDVSLPENDTHAPAAAPSFETAQEFDVPVYLPRIMTSEDYARARQQQQQQQPSSQSARRSRRRIHRSRYQFEAESDDDEDDGPDGDDGFELRAKRLASAFSKFHIDSTKRASFESKHPPYSHPQTLTLYRRPAENPLHSDTESDTSDEQQADHHTLMTRLKTLRPDLSDELIREICRKLTNPSELALLPANVAQWMFNYLLKPGPDQPVDSDSDDEYASNVIIEELADDGMVV